MTSLYVMIPGAARTEQVVRGQHGGIGWASKTRTWQRECYRAILAELDNEPCFTKEESLSVYIDVSIKRPKTIKREHPTVPPDVDKLARPILDAFVKAHKAVARRPEHIIDDKQIIELAIAKYYDDIDKVELHIRVA